MITVDDPAPNEVRLRLALRDGLQVREVTGDIAALLGFSSDDFLSARVSLKDQIHTHDEDIAAVLFSPTTDPVAGEFNIRLRQANGRILCCKGSYRKELAADGVLLDLRLADAKRLPRTMADASTLPSFRAMMENTDDFIFFKDRNHVMTGASQTLVSLCHPAEHWTDLLGQTDYDIFPEPYADIYYRLEKQIFAGMPVVHEVQEYLSKDGRKGWVDNRKYAIAGDTGETIGLYGIARDITERVLAEEALRESEERLRLALSAAKQAWFDVELNTGALSVSVEYARMLGYDPNEFHSNLQNWLANIHPEDHDAIVSTFQACVADGGPHTMEYRRRTKAGDWKWLQSIGKVVEWDDQQRATRMIGIHTDITERKRTEAELERHRHHLEAMVEERTAALSIAKEAAETANRAKSTFLANMSHELRTPMTGVMGMVDLVLRRTTDEKTRKQLTMAQRSSQHLLSVINDILDISRIEAERLTLETTELKLADVLENLTTLINQHVTEKGLALHIDVPADLAAQTLQGDPLRLSQILLNLTGNAVKFATHGSIVVRVQRIRTGDVDDASMLLRFEIQDSGIGITPEDQKRLFTAFEQADGSMTRKYGGTGLGLAICKRLVQMMDGQIGVDSIPGHGSTFWFTVRLAQGRSAAVPSAPTFSSATAESRLRRDYAGTRILLAEDEPVSQEVSRGLLENVGFQVDLADDGMFAVNLAQRLPYALILMDMQMPHLNGIDAARAIRADSLNMATPILAMTANAFDEDRKLCLAAGMNDHITKPINPDVLYETLVTWLVKAGA